MTQQGIKAIETRYAGCRFRSRLEARWAVFFDRLGIRWHYEEQGYELPSGRYLPDFRLEKAGGLGHGDVHVEIKGSFNHADFVKVLHAAVELPTAEGSVAVLAPKVLVLGEVPEPGLASAAAHTQLYVADDLVLITEVMFDCIDNRLSEAPQFGTRVVNEVVAWRASWIKHLADDEKTQALRDGWTRPAVLDYATRHGLVDDAYRAARSARFEFGESGA